MTRMALHPDNWERIRRSVRATEANPPWVGQGETTLGGEQPSGLDYGGHHMWVRTAAASPDGGGHYAGKTCLFDAGTNTLADLGDVLVREVNGGKLRQTDATGATVYYFARAEGEVGGVEVFVPVSEASSYQTVTGTTDYGTSAAAGTSPPGQLDLPTLTGTTSLPSWTPPVAGKYPVEYVAQNQTLAIYDQATSKWYGVAGGNVTVAPVFNITTSVTNSKVPVKTQTLTSTGTPAGGFGISDPVYLTPTTGAAVQVADTTYSFATTATPGGYDAQIQQSVTDAGSTTHYLTVLSAAGVVTTTLVGALTVQVNTPVTNAVQVGLTLKPVLTAGTVAMGFGVSLNFSLPSDNGTPRDIPAIKKSWKDPTNGSEYSKLGFVVMRNGVQVTPFTVEDDVVRVDRPLQVQDDISGNPGEVRVFEAVANGTDYVALVAPSALAASMSYTLPMALPAASGNVLACTTGGVMSWVAASGGSITGLTAGRLVFSTGATSVGDSPDALWDDTNKVMGLTGASGNTTLAVTNGSYFADLGSNGGAADGYAVAGVKGSYAGYLAKFLGDSGDTKAGHFTDGASTVDLIDGTNCIKINNGGTGVVVTLGITGTQAAQLTDGLGHILDLCDGTFAIKAFGDAKFFGSGFGPMTFTVVPDGTTTAIKADSTGVVFFGTTTVAQYSTTGTTIGFTAGAGTAAKSDSTYTGNTGGTAYTNGDVVRALKLYGLLAP